MSDEKNHLVHPDGYCEGCGDTPCKLDELDLLQQARAEAYAEALEAAASDRDLGAHIMSHHGSQAQQDCFLNAAKNIRALPNPYEVEE